MSEPVVHDGPRCPDCGSHGTIVDVRTSSAAPNTQSRVRSRIYDCWDCPTRWRQYA